MAEGNRKDPRARVLNMTVRYKSATVDEFIENHSHDISKGGIFIKTRAPFPAGTLLKFEVRIAEDQRLMQGVGRVVWRREPERAEDGFPAGMGIKFIKTGEGAAELISQIIAAREGEESSFDTGARENGELPASDPGRRSAAPAAAEAAAVPHLDAPALHVESGPPGSLPVDGEFRVSSPPKKRAAASETRKVVLQGAAVEAPASDKTPLSAPARAVTAQLAGGERAPSRPVATGRDRSSIVDETTAPRARAAGEAKAASSSSPSVYGLVAILGLVALTLLFVKLARDPEPEAAVAPPPPTTSTSPAVAPPPVAPLPSEPTTVAAPPSGETGEGAGEPVAPAEPTAAPPAAASPAPTVPAQAAGAGASPARAPSAEAPSPAAPAAPKPAPSVAASAPKPPAAAAPTPPPAAATPPPPKPKVVAKPAAPSPPTEPTLSVRPAPPEAAPTAPGSEPTGSEQRPAEPAKKRPPAAAAGPEPAPTPAPAPSPKPVPSDDNPY